MITITFPMVGPSANKFYAGMHPMKRRKLVKAWHELVAICVMKDNIKPYAGKYPVIVECRCLVPPGSRRYDPDNVFATEKLIVDGLVKCRILKGDSSKWIAETRLSCRHNTIREWQTVITIRSARNV